MLWISSAFVQHKSHVYSTKVYSGLEPIKRNVNEYRGEWGGGSIMLRHGARQPGQLWVCPEAVCEERLRQRSATIPIRWLLQKRPANESCVSRTAKDLTDRSMAGRPKQDSLYKFLEGRHLERLPRLQRRQPLNWNTAIVVCTASLSWNISSSLSDLWV